jgi:hypothetical protein
MSVFAASARWSRAAQSMSAFACDGKPMTPLEVYALMPRVVRARRSQRRGLVKIARAAIVALLAKAAALHSGLYSSRGARWHSTSHLR